MLIHKYLGEMLNWIKKKWIERKAKLLLKNHHDVYAVAIGTKHTNGKDTGKQCIKAFVVEKKKNVCPKSMVPKVWKGELTDVESIGAVKKLVDSKMYNSVIGGCEISVPGFNTVGTLGCIFKQKIFNRLVLNGIWDMTEVLTKFGLENMITTRYVGLTNKHVVTQSIKDNPKNNSISQPYGGHIVGKVIDSDTELDSAIIQMSRLSSDNEIIHCGKVTQLDLPYTTVKTYGRTTEYVDGGKLIYQKIFVNIDYGSQDGLRTVECMMFDLKSLPGNSGALILNEHNSPVALLFAGSELYTFGIDFKKIKKRYLL